MREKIVKKLYKNGCTNIISPTKNTRIVLENEKKLYVPSRRGDT